MKREQMNPYIIPGLKETKDPIQLACKLFKVSKTDLLSRTRKGEINKVRQMLMYYFNKVDGLSQQLTGELFNRDRVTVIHACKVVDNLCETDKNYEKELYNFFEQLI